MNPKIELNKNDIVKFLGKLQADFTRDDIIKYIVKNDIEMLNFMYPAADGHLKTLNFVINDLEYLKNILVLGERVDGSSLFPFISAGSSDLYVIPRYRTAFRDPFAEIPTLTMLCSYCDKDGNPLEMSPEYTLQKACSQFTKTTGLTFQAMGELEYYVISDDTGRFPAVDQHGYHESAPFAKFNDFRSLCMNYIARTGGQIKYGHSEVGNFTIGGKVYEQNEIEFLPVNAEDAADQIMIAKWIIRNLAFRLNYDVTFAPKITTGKAGSGLHIHIRLMDKDKNVMLGPDKKISDEARKAIAGLMKLAPALTAFGNTNPTSYFRLVPHQEAPTNICWGDRNRSVLVRLPLGWTADNDMCAAVNPRQSTPIDTDPTLKQTVEIRSGDGTADIYLYLAAIAVALRYGFEMPDALETARQTYVDINIHSSENSEKARRLEALPADCAQSAEALEKNAAIFEQYNVFSPKIIDSTIVRLNSFDPQEIENAKNDPEVMAALVTRYFYC